MGQESTAALDGPRGPPHRVVRGQPSPCSGRCGAWPSRRRPQGARCRHPRGGRCQRPRLDRVLDRPSRGPQHVPGTSPRHHALFGGCADRDDRFDAGRGTRRPLVGAVAGGRGPSLGLARPVYRGRDPEPPLHGLAGVLRAAAPPPLAWDAVLRPFGCPPPPLLFGPAAHFPPLGGGAGFWPPPWGWLALCIGVAILSHLYMDWQGSYGLRPFLPWHGTWYYADWVAIADPFFWLVPLMALAWGAERHWVPLLAVLLVGGAATTAVVLNADLAARWVLITYFALCVVAAIGWVRYWVGPVARRRVAVFALLILAAYAGAQGIVAQVAKAAIHHRATERFVPAAQWAALTRVGTPFLWDEIYATADTVAGNGWRLPRHLDAPIVQRAVHDTREGRAMAQFARFLVAEVDSSGVDEVTVYLRYARYARAGRRGWGVVSASLPRGP